MAVSKRLRYEILRRDNHACRYCGAVAPDVPLTVDHVVPVALGGSDDPSNLVAACRDCNSGKSATPVGAEIVAGVEQDAVRWAQAIHLAAERAAVGREVREEVERAVLDIFGGYTVPSYRGGGTLADYVPGDFFVSLEQFMKSGLVRTELVEAAFITCEAPGVQPQNTWRYFCGVCWGKVRERQNAARALIDSEEMDEAVSQFPPCDGNHPPITPLVRYAARLYTQLSQVCDGSAA